MAAPLPRRVLLGAELPADAVAFTTAGMTIAGVSAEGMAAQAGLVAGDVLTHLGGHPVRSLAELAAALRAAAGVAVVPLVFTRAGSPHTAHAAPRPLPVTPVSGAEVVLGELVVPGARLRTVTTRVAAPRALVLVLQGIACESIEAPPDAPLAGLVAGWAHDGIEAVRFDKRGVGDSEGGPCPATDFATELADARAALLHAAAVAHARGVPLCVYGHSVGGMIAVLLAPGCSALAGVMVFGAPTSRWLACLQASARRQLGLRGADAATIEARVGALADLARTGDLNGRSAAYHAQLDALDLAAAWRAVTCPVLVLRGEFDWVVDPADQARIATLAAGPVDVVDVPGLDHLGGAHADAAASLADYGAGGFDPVLVDATAGWLITTLGSTLSTISSNRP